jgi:hypothetical protein
MIKTRRDLYMSQGREKNEKKFLLVAAKSAVNSQLLANSSTKRSEILAVLNRS